DGKELTADDVVFSFNRVRTDSQSQQKQNIASVKEMIAVDPYIVKVVTKKPTASLLEFLFDRFIITGKDLYDKYSAREADRKYLGMGALQAEGLRDRPAHRAGEGPRQSGGQAREPRPDHLHHHAGAGAARHRPAQQ